ncbi:MAG: NUDIX domain-containing protein [Tabrizicola sp.]|jgi:nudix-type nucleoside diphosphatase (YffH/AdpP family)|nr:NUDIX domain-containing protein [Tabrizicola sp.]
MPADAGNELTGLPKAWSAAVQAIVFGSDPDHAAERAAFFAQVLGRGDLPDATAEALALAELVMQAQGRLSAKTVADRLPSLRVEAASRARAALAPRRGLRQGSGEVTVETTEPLHAGFFATTGYALHHRRFDGSPSPRLVREVFVVGDAVTVLPYDPLRDRVLLIEQFRMGPFGRGDPMPWQLEAIAGRIDPGETPEDAARREAVEEAGLVLGALEKVAEYYPTPGAVAEYLYSYVALCDLPDGVAGVFGAAEEAEDIKGHLVSFDRLVEVMTAGEIGNAPLLLTVLWLQRERARLRG